MNHPKLIKSDDNSEIIIDNDKFSIGRSIVCSHILTDINISRLQVYIEKEGNDWILRDLSTNGTVVDNIKYTKNQTVKLKPGSTIQFSNDLKYKFDLNIPFKMQNLDNTLIFNGTEMPKPMEIEVIDLVKNPSEPTTSTSTIESRRTARKRRIKPIKDGKSPKITKKDDRNAEAPVNSAVPENSEAPIIVSDNLGNTGKVATSENAPANNYANESITSSDKVMQESTCSICSELFIETKTLSCQHSFCSYCIDTWTKKNKNCPVCRSKITCSVRTLALDNIIEMLVNKLSPEDKKSREEVIQERQKEKSKAKDTNKKETTTNRQGRGRGRMVTRNQGRRSLTLSVFPNSNDAIEIPDTDDSSDSDSFITDMADDLSIIFNNFPIFMDGVGGRYPYRGNRGGYGQGGNRNEYEQGDCFICHQPGHWANRCPEREMRR